jgi:alkylhydroperoxidase family enzyme
VRDPYAEHFEQLRQGVLEGPGVLDPEVRRALAAGVTIEPELQAYADKVRTHAYRVVDRDLDALARVGYTEEQIFEATVSVAVGAASARLETALAVLAEHSAR